MNNALNRSLLYFIVSVIGILTTFNSNLFAQKIPDYSERVQFFSPDTSLKNLSNPGTYGVINENDYILGPGDILTLVLLGLQETVVQLPVAIDGSIYIPKSGSLKVAGLSLAQARSKITEIIEKTYRNVDVYVNLTVIKIIRVSLYGDIKQPSSYSLPANFRLSDLLSNSKGITLTSDLRNIQIKRINGDSLNVDLLKYFRFGDFGGNPYLREGDFVFIEPADRFITIGGQVKFPGTYEFRDGESLGGILRLCGNLTEKARTDSIELIRFLPDNLRQRKEFYTFNQIESNNISLKNGDRVIVREIPKIFDENLVFIEGYVNFPGPYLIENNKTTLSEIIEMSGGFRDDAAIEDISLIRMSERVDLDPEFERLKLIPIADMSYDEYDYFKSKARQRYGKVVVDFYKLFILGDKSEDITLKKNDKIIVPDQKNHIALIGQVVNPGKVPYEKRYTINDYIAIAGGFGWRADISEVRVIRVNTGEWIDANDVDILYPGDTIWVPEEEKPPRFWDIFMDTLTILGQVATVIAATVAVIISTR
ncbi:MAG: SLBB domain-containing protein [Ignavibacteriaceae bacterium]|nr:SLBB domain-containing protein [Ignavibacteriaceae bacterium]